MANQNLTPSTSPFAERFRRVDSVVTTEQAETTILLDLRSGRYYTLNAVGGLIWSVLATGVSMDRLIARVRAEFDAPDEQLTNDVKEFIESLLSTKLIRWDG